MKLTDTRFWIYELLSIICGELTFCIAAVTWFAMSQVNWFPILTIQLTIVLCWALGGLISWVTAKSVGNIPVRTYIWANCVYLVVTIYNISNGNASINGWYVLFCLGFGILSLPALALMTILSAKIGSMTNRIKAFGLVLLTALPLLAINLIGNRPRVSRDDMIVNAANEVIEMVDDFKNKNGRLPNNLDELGASFEKIDKSYKYKDNTFYYEPRKDGYYWLTVTFGQDENYCFNSKDKSWIWGCDSAQVEDHKMFQLEDDSIKNAER